MAKRLKINQKILARLKITQQKIRNLIADNQDRCTVDQEIKDRLRQTQYVQSWILGPLDQAIADIEGES